MSRSDTPMLSLQRLQIAYGEMVAVREFSLDIAEGEFFTLLGPSGCGKTSVLRTIAGFVPARSGAISIDGKDVTAMPAEQRDVGIVFQNYALFPHMSVFENVAFGMRVARRSRRVIEATVGHMLQAIGIADQAAKRPEALSGGQQQRVAIARALVMGTKVLLFDEPLSNLDAKIRESMRREIKRLQRELGFTALFVTHDQEEALALSDRLVVMNDGRIEQIGTGKNLYRHPASSFVCRFIGEANDMPAALLERRCPQIVQSNGDAKYHLRPEDIRIATQIRPNDVRLKGTIGDVDFLGRLTRIECLVEGHILALVIHDSELGDPFIRGDDVELGLDPSKLHIYAENEL